MQYKIDGDKLDKVMELLDTKVSRIYTRREIEVFVCADVHGPSISLQDYLDTALPEEIANWVSRELPAKSKWR